MFSCANIKLEDLRKVGHIFYVATPKHKDCLQMRQVQRLREIEPYFCKMRIGNIVASLKSKGVSLRVVDWLVTNYARKTKFGFWKEKNGSLCYIDLHQTYRNVLKIWRRKLFDPFQRFQRVFYLLDGEFVTTTVGQLNFFKVMSEQCNLMEVLKNRQLVEAVKRDMIQAQIDKAAKKDPLAKIKSRTFEDHGNIHFTDLHPS